MEPGRVHRDVERGAVVCDRQAGGVERGRGKGVGRTDHHHADALACPRTRRGDGWRETSVAQGLVQAAIADDEHPCAGMV